MNIQLIPKEIQSIIPRFDGDDKLLNLFISKCEYVIRSFRGENNPAQQTYLFHCITSRLVGKAAVLISERENVTTWEGLKELFVQHFGDPRSEACISIELENLKIKQGESYIDFCHRIQNVRSSLISKVNLLTDEGIKAAKYIIYNNTALNVFLYNLPEDLIKFVRLNKCDTLESALSIVTEEVNFQTRYNSRNKNKTNPSNTNPTSNNPKPTPTAQIQQKFGIPANPGFKQQNAFKPNFNPNPNQVNPRFGFQPKPQLQNQAQKPQIPHQSQQLPRTINNYKQSGFFKANPNQQFRFGVNNPPPRQNTDVSMRTVRNNMIEEPFETDVNNEVLYYFDGNSCIELVEVADDNNQSNCIQNDTENENFQIEASVPDQQK
ncbi:unnamed protein product [Spodoptera littoralis]|uniref:Cytadhesion n=1 Tax=Spodoptera littoralis TaxID=7109 RepID=A0A9P0ID84_SPOLI|nr:unnamed protein product [Spodoptera littoralis]CAH1644084.1 unnamed protein product [Spodoptera littoralis]